MKRIKIIIITILSFFIYFNTTSADSINSINMEINIDKNGNAIIEEVWNVYLTSGTEGYKAFDKIKNSEIINYTVTDNDTIYTNIGKWNSNASFEDKAYKNGIKNKFGGLELCWGISKYGYRSYKLNYTITNFVNQYKDYQGIYYKLINLEQDVNEVNININTTYPLNETNSKIWGFGYEGTILFTNNGVTLHTDSLNSKEYITLLMKFEEPTFNTNKKVNKTFKKVFISAMQKPKFAEFTEFFKVLINNPYGLIFTFFIAIIFLEYFIALSVSLIKNIIKKIFPNNNIEYINSIKKLKKKKNIGYYRDIPCNSDIELAYFILNKLNIVKTKELKKGIIGAYILKWIKLKYVTISNDKKSLVLSEEFYQKRMNNEITLDSVSENKLYSILYIASNEDHILNPKEFKKYSKKNYKLLNKWYNDILIIKKSQLESQRKFISYTKKILLKKDYYTEFSDELINEAYNLVGLKNFLLDFSNIKDRSVPEVTLWEYYLIYATLFGIADKIDKELKELYPDLNIDNYIKLEQVLDMINEYSEASYRGMKTSINLNNMKKDIENFLASSGSSSSSSSYRGGGGSSFSSGGSSSRGSSGGGFR